MSKISDIFFLLYPILKSKSIRIRHFLPESDSAKTNAQAKPKTGKKTRIVTMNSMNIRKAPKFTYGICSIKAYITI